MLQRKSWSSIISASGVALPNFTLSSLNMDRCTDNDHLPNTAVEEVQESQVVTITHISIASYCYTLAYSDHICIYSLINFRAPRKARHSFYVETNIYTHVTKESPITCTCPIMSTIS